MAIYKRKTFRRKVFRRKPKTLAQKAYRMAKSIKRTYKPEVKKSDKGQSTYNVGTVAGVIPVTSIAQGDDNLTRSAHKILVKSVVAKGWIKHNNTASDGQVVKVWLIQDKQQVGDTAPTAANIFTVQGNSVTSPLNPDTVGRFKILWSKTFILDPSNEIKTMYMFKRLSLPVRYNGATISDIQKNGLYILYASSDDANKPTLTIDIRTSFYDN